MGHTHINTIEKYSPCNHNNRKEKDIANPVSSWMLIHPHSNNLSQGKQ